MRTLALSIGLALALAVPLQSSAQSAPHLPPPPRVDVTRIPQVILDGLEELRRDQLDEAETAWRKDSSFLSPGAAGSTLRLFKQQDGEYQGFELISVEEVTQRTRIIYLALNYERQPHFARFVAYRTLKEWVLLQLDLNIDMTTMQTELAGQAQK